MSVEIVTELLGWLCILNIGLLLFSTILIVSMRETISDIHSKMFGLDKKDLGKAYFQYIAQYKIAIIVLNLSPYLALKIMTG